MKVRVVGDWFGGTSGYSAHCKGLCSGLVGAGFDVRVSCNKPADWVRYCSDSEMKMFTIPSDSEEIMVYIGQPQFWRYGLSEKPKKFIGVLVWEGSAIPKSVLPYLLDSRVDQIWVPSQHVYAACMETLSDYALHQKIKIVDHGFDPSLFNCVRGTSKYENDKANRPFTFVCNKGLVHPVEDRGGLQYAIKAFYDEFSAGENVRLLLKINGAYVNPPDKAAWIKGMIREIVGSDVQKADILATMDTIPASDMRDFYGQGDVFLSPVRAEGFNLPGLEAKACGLATIQTDFGGQKGYMTPETDYYITGDLVPVTWDVSYEEVSWLKPNMDELRRVLRYCFEHQDEVAQKGLLSAKGVRDWTWLDTGLKAKKYLDELGVDTS